MLETAAQTGDTRLASRADALLARIPANNHTAAVLGLRAFNAQHKHDFSEALRWLDVLSAVAPRNASALQTRAEIQIVQGTLDAARADCTRLALGIDAEKGLLCIASLAFRTGNFDQAAGLLDHWLLLAAPGDPSRRFVLVLRAEVVSLDGDAKGADTFFRQALAQSPDDVRTLAAYSRHLRRTRRDREVEALLDGALQSDSLQLKRALAAQVAGRGNAGALAAAQGRRYAVAHAAGTQPEMRDEAEFLLTLRGDPDAALALARRNFDEQRDYEDVDILVRAANAAGKPEALGSLRTWAKSQAVRLPATAQAKP